ncbi:MAG: hypothetical protein IPK26_27805 [Planctomycetes bacterium]|nr:hypothetical protein [Planctomycetota bacterium]
MRTVLSLSLLVVCACGQIPPVPEPAPPAAQDPQALLAEAMKQFAAENIQVDLKAGTVTIPCTMNAPPDPCEYLLIHARGKRHEALLITKSKPSLLNGAMLMLGLTPGKNAEVKEKVPPPTIEEIEKGVDPVIITPPEGMPYWMTVAWKDEAGKPQELAVEDLIFDLRRQQPVRGIHWVFLGGRMASLLRGEEPVFVADFEGNLVSICYMTPENHLGTGVHEDARDESNWWTTEACPPPGTEMTITFHRKQPKLCVEREARVAKEIAAEEAAAKAAAAKAAAEGKEPGKGDGK